MSNIVAIMSMSLDGYLAGAPAVLGNPTVITGVGVTHLRYPVHKA
jgi:hypothetical protein